MTTIVEQTKKIQRMEALITLNRTKIKVLELVVEQSKVGKVDDSLMEILNYLDKEREKLQ